MDELKGKLDKHRYHIRKLETLLRMLDNMSVEVNTVSVPIIINSNFVIYIYSAVL